MDTERNHVTVTLCIVGLSAHFRSLERTGLRSGSGRGLDDDGGPAAEPAAATASAPAPLKPTASRLLAVLLVAVDRPQSRHLLGDASSLVLTQLALHLVRVPPRPTSCSIIVVGVVQRLSRPSHRPPVATVIAHVIK